MRAEVQAGVRDLQIGLEPDSICALVNRLVPLSESGDKQEEFSDSISATGPTMTTTDTYTNVIVQGVI